MAATVSAPAVTAGKPVGAEGPRPYRWTREAFHRLFDLGVLQDGERVELIEGELLAMPVPKPPHAASLVLTHETLTQVFGAGFHVRIQSPLALGEYSEPEPDVAAVRGRARDYANDHPTPADTVLVIEVSDTTLRYDRGRKASLYARVGISDYWILNLQERCIEVMRDPVPMEGTPYGAEYSTRFSVPGDGEVAPLAAPDYPVKAADLLP